MTDRLKGCVVAFEADIREDDAEATLAAIRQIKGVVAVTPSVVTPDDWINRSQVRTELTEKVLEVLIPKAERS
jgi:hypothetical protein